jgi:hypothetical protein
MSQRLISLNPDLRRLRDEGYDVEIRSGKLIVRGVPYLNSARVVRYGVLASSLSLAGDLTQPPNPHTVQFAGEYPCDADGREIDKIRLSNRIEDIGDGIVFQFEFSSKPALGYKDYYDKMATYITILSGPAELLDRTATARRFAPSADDFDSVFEYVDTASSRAGIVAANNRLSSENVGIVGLGGTGAYVLDFVSKMPVSEIHLFDGDKLLQHNAFRAPGAAALSDLRLGSSKVAYYHSIYSRMRKRVFGHECYVTGENVDLLSTMSFVFLCIDAGESKEAIIAKLEDLNIPFIDCGMRLHFDGVQLGGMLRVTTSAGSMRSHVRLRRRVSFAGGVVDDPYRSNIQVAELNALTATLAVIKWKKLRHIYRDLDLEHHSVYTIDGNALANDDKLCASSAE